MRRRSLGAFLATATAALTLVPAPVGAGGLRSDLTEVVDRIRELTRQIDDMTAERSHLAARIRAAGGTLDALIADVSANELALGDLEAKMRTSERYLGDLRVHLVVSHTSLFETRSTIARQRSRAMAAARDAYVSGRRDFQTATLSARRVVDASVGLVYLERVAAHNRSVLTTLLALEDHEEEQRARVVEQEALLEDEQARAGGLRADLERVRDRHEVDRALLEETIVGLESLLDELDLVLVEFEDELDKHQVEQHKIRRRIVAEQAKKQVGPAISTADLMRPVPGVVTSAFGSRHHPILGYERMHTGVDMSASRGQSVKSAKGGTVILSSTWGGYGRTVVVDHGSGLSTLYAHLSKVLVAKGDSVEPGTVVGKAGSSGLASGPHLHFEVRVGGNPVDPAPYLRG